MEDFHIGLFLNLLYYSMGLNAKRGEGQMCHWKNAHYIYFQENTYFGTKIRLLNNIHNNQTITYKILYNRATKYLMLKVNLLILINF